MLKLTTEPIYEDEVPVPGLSGVLMAAEGSDLSPALSLVPCSEDDDDVC